MIGIGYHVASEVMPVCSVVLVVVAAATLSENVPVMVGAREEGKV